MINVAFTGGGTGGHIYPGLAVAAELANQAGNVRIFWIGSSAGMDRSLVEEAGIEFFGIPSGKLRRYFSLKNIADIFKILAGFFAAKKILKEQNAVLLFSKGGFVSVPPCAAAASLKIPVFTHESDYSPGLATKLNARFVKRTGGKIFTAYEDTARFFKEKLRRDVIVSGNPLRAIFRAADAAKGRAFLGVSENARILLVLGGSQGAKEVNDLIRAALSEITKTFTVIHQTGSAREWDFPAMENYKPFPYIKEELPHVMAAAEIIAGRSGAGIWEWAALGKPMVLIPLRKAARGDQAQNARFFQNAGAAVVLGENASANDLLLAINSLAADNDKRQKMAAASSQIAKTDSAAFIAGVLAENLKSMIGGDN